MLDYELLCYLRTRLRFDAASGIFYWLPRADNYPWSQKFKGKVAGSNDKDGYRVLAINYGGKTHGIKLHRLAWAFHNDQIPCGEIDHVNHSKSDNRPENLRVVGREANTKNLSWNSRNTSGFIGVSKSNSAGMWRARLRHNKKEIVVGHFSSPELANQALMATRSKYGYHDNHGDAK
jgi:hypothetical protein